jgi:type II secretory pathway component PulL
MVMDQALALAVRPLKDGMGFDFRRMQQREGKSYGHMKRDMRLALMAAGLVFILGGADIFLDYYIQKNRLAELKARIQTIYRQYNPDGGRIVEPLSQMRAKITEMRKMALGSTETTTDMSALDVLKEISGLIPPTMEVLITSWAMEHDAVVVKGEAKNFDTVQIIRNELGKSKRFRSVNIGTTTMLKQGEKVEFDLKVTLK